MDFGCIEISEELLINKLAEPRFQKKSLQSLAPVETIRNLLLNHFPRDPPLLTNCGGSS
jgi:hypothetical protein